MRVPNLQSPLVDKDTGKVISPWNSFFQKFTQKAPAAQAVIGVSPISFTASQPGNLIILGGVISNINLNRGLQNFNLTGEKVVPVGIGDTVTVTFTGPTAINFMG